MARILVAEHQRDVRDLLEAELKAAGHAVVVADGGRAALRLAGARRPDVVLLDLALADMAAIDFAKAMRSDARTHDVRILAIAERGEQIEHVMGIPDGADDYLVKPFSVRE